MTEPNLRAVHDSELEGLLARLGVFDDFTAGNARCTFCEDPINEDNLYAIFPISNLVRFSCSKPECIEALAAKSAEERRT